MTPLLHIECVKSYNRTHLCIKTSWSCLSLKLNRAGSGYSRASLSLPVADALASRPTVVFIAFSLA